MSDFVKLHAAEFILSEVLANIVLINNYYMEIFTYI